MCVYDWIRQAESEMVDEVRPGEGGREGSNVARNELEVYQGGL